MPSLVKINTATYSKYGSCLYLRIISPNLSTNTTISEKTKWFYPFTVIILRIWEGQGVN